MMALWIRELNLSYNKNYCQEWMMGRDRRYLYRKDVLLVAFIIKMNILSLLSDSNIRKFYLVSSLSAGDKIKLFYLCNLSDLFYLL